jgi:hypothetical protein
MNREDIIRMAREAGFETKHDMAWVHDWEITPTLTRFAAFVAAAVRKDFDYRLGLLIQEEREACAKHFDDSDTMIYRSEVAAAIRARSNA